MLLDKSQSIRNLDEQICSFEKLSKRIFGIACKEKKQLQKEILLLTLLSKQASQAIQKISDENENSEIELLEINSTIDTLKELQQVISIIAGVYKAENELVVCRGNDNFNNGVNHIQHYAC